MELLLRVQKLLHEKDVNATINDGELFFQARFGPVGGRIRVSASKSAFTVCAHLGLFVPVHRLAAMYEAISRANYNLVFLRFECDSSDGELRLRGDMPRYPHNLGMTIAIFNLRGKPVLDLPEAPG